MTLAECILEIDEIEPNAYSEDQKVKWVLQAEKSVSTCVFLMDAEDANLTDLIAFDEYDFPLLAPSPFDQLYLAYLHAMIHYANSEYERYQNDMQLYNAQFGEFARWFAGKYEPALTMRKTEFRVYGTGDYDYPVIPIPQGCVIGRAEIVWTDSSSSSDTVSFEYWDREYGLTHDPISYLVNDQCLIALRAGRGAELRGFVHLPTDCYVRFNLYRYGWPDQYGRRP